MTDASSRVTGCCTAYLSLLRGTDICKYEVPCCTPARNFPRHRSGTLLHYCRSFKPLSSNPTSREVLNPGQHPAHQGKPKCLELTAALQSEWEPKITGPYCNNTHKKDPTLQKRPYPQPRNSTPLGLAARAGHKEICHSAADSSVATTPTAACNYPISHSPLPCQR